MLEKIGIDDKTRKERGVVYHSWRHFMAKNLVEKGTNKAIGMKILGQKPRSLSDLGKIQVICKKKIHKKDKV